MIATFTFTVRALVATVPVLLILPRTRRLGCGLAVAFTVLVTVLLVVEIMGVDVFGIGQYT